MLQGGEADGAESGARGRGGRADARALELEHALGELEALQEKQRSEVREPGDPSSLTLDAEGCSKQDMHGQLSHPAGPELKKVVAF